MSRPANLLVVLVMLTSCSTTRTNDDKGVTRPTYCHPVDRCDK